MKSGVRLLVLAALAAVFFLEACSRPMAPQPSCNFVQNPDLQRVSWKGKLPIKLYVHESVPAEALPALNRAIAMYKNLAPGGGDYFTIEQTGVGGPLNPTKDGYSTIYWFNTWDPTSPNEQARTTIYWSGNEIFEADMRINAANFTYNYGDNTNFSNVDLDSIFVHELGHVLGLAHNTLPGSVMHATLDQGQVRRTLVAADVSDLTCEY